MKAAYIAIPIVVGLLVIVAQAYAMGPLTSKYMPTKGNKYIENHTNQIVNHTNRTMNKEEKRMENHTNQMIKRTHRWMQKAHYMRFKDRLKLGMETRERFENSYKNWQHAREQCQLGNCSMYFNATQNMLLTSINVSIERLDSINSTTAQELISELNNYSIQIQDANNISELRAIYPEVKAAIQQANQIYEKSTLIDLANTYLDYLNEKPQTKEVIGIENQIKNLINNSSNMFVKDIVIQLKMIRGEIIALG